MYGDTCHENRSLPPSRTLGDIQWGVYTLQVTSLIDWARKYPKPPLEHGRVGITFLCLMKTHKTQVCRPSVKRPRTTLLRSRPPWREGPDTSGFLGLLIASVDNDMKECVLSGLFWVTFKHCTLNLGTLSGSQATANLCQVRK